MKCRVTATIENILKDLNVSRDRNLESVKAFFMEEIWKDIPGYEGHYQVSDQGRVKSLKTSKNRILKQTLNKQRGYLNVALSLNGFLKTKTVHQLVVMAFLNHKPNGTQKIVVDHIDRNKANNKLSNLRLVSQRENASRREGGYSKYTGVTWHKTDKKWIASIRINGPKKHLGYFKCEFAAHVAYQKELQLLNK